MSTPVAATHRGPQHEATTTGPGPGALEPPHTFLDGVGPAISGVDAARSELGGRRLL